MDIDNGFRPIFEVVPQRAKILAELKRAARKASRIYLATDPDREGEAISHDLAEEFRAALGKRREVPVRRIVFHEITPPAVRRALEAAGDVDRDKVSAQQTRRVLDRIVGYKISPLLSRKVAPRLSAGRVQSIALRLICEREREIRAFRVAEYWTMQARLKTPAGEIVVATAVTPKAPPGKPVVGEEAIANAIAETLGAAKFRVAAIERKRRTERPPPPFITSSLQRQASSAFRFPAARTMRTAQALYEGVDLGDGDRVGLITYLRTDSVRVSAEAVAEVRQLIGERFGAEALPERPNYFRKPKGAQDAHEAIRPTSARRTPEAMAPYLNDDQKRLYRLIWERFAASQMRPALFDDTRVVIAAAYSHRNSASDEAPVVPGFGPAPDRLHTSGSVLVARGYRVLYRETKEDADPERDDAKKRPLPQLRTDEELSKERILPLQHFTKPPARYSEAGLIRKLEANGIGRPSTYVPTLRRIKDREYVRMRKRVFEPTEVGMLVSDLLTHSFDALFNVRYTAAMEDSLDRIEQGEADYLTTLSDFYRDFATTLERARADMPRIKGIPTAERCELCGGPLVIRWSGGEKFLGCAKYPDCRGTRSLPAAENDGAEEEPPACPECGAPMAARRGRFGPFLGCTRYPECDTLIQLRDGRLIQKQKPTPVGGACPECSRPLVRRQGRRGPFVGCSGFPSCRYIQPRPKRAGAGSAKKDKAGGDGEKAASKGAAPSGARAGG